MKQSNDSLGDRMKGYENAYRTSLPMRMPVILRVDGCHFHSYVEGCKKPFDDSLIETMNDTASYLCKNIQGATLAYVQSDEISILLNNYQELNSQAWFSNHLQKMVSVSASMAGAIFTMNSWKIWGYDVNDVMIPIIKPAFFDCRAFILPKEEVCNYFLWRQQDATRNSVQMLARSLYSHKDCTDKNNSELQEMIFQKEKNWNDEPTSYKRGRCVIKETYEANGATRNRWVIDNEIPIFSADRDYINRSVWNEETKEIQ
jgi:tRNA(His) guanylyltransferase